MFKRQAMLEPHNFTQLWPQLDGMVLTFLLKDTQQSQPNNLGVQGRPQKQLFIIISFGFYHTTEKLQNFIAQQIYNKIYAIRHYYYITASFPLQHHNFIFFPLECHHLHVDIHSSKSKDDLPSFKEGNSTVNVLKHQTDYCLPCQCQEI